MHRCALSMALALFCSFFPVSGNAEGYASGRGFPFLCEGRDRLGLGNTVDGECTVIDRSGAPAPRLNEVLIWTGDRLIVWGGRLLKEDQTFEWTQTGSIFDPAKNVWTPMTTDGAPPPSDRPLVVHAPGVRADSPGHLLVRPSESDQLYLYDLQKSRWSKARKAPDGLGGATLAVVGRKRVWFGTGSPRVGLDASKSTQCYDVRRDKWKKCSGKPQPPRGADGEGRSWHSFDYGRGYVLVPRDDNGELPRFTPSREMVRTKFPLPRVDSYVGLPLERIATPGKAELYRYGPSLDILYGKLPDGTLTRIAGLVGGGKPLAVRIGEEPRDFRLVWTGALLIAWGGTAPDVRRYDCTPPCPPGAPCLRRMCKEIVTTIYNDGLVYRPAPEKWGCLFRVISGEKGFLGVGLSETLRAGTRTVKVHKILPEGPASTSGLKEGDIFLAVNGKTFQTAAELTSLVSGHARGAEVTLTVRRDGEKRDLKVKLGGQARTLPGGPCP